ncbi:hypothetical protein [Actinomycetospora straminea]|nr:hypothetical protein [Actinomycetospora straminea]MDD7933407.1 hypothetical protein [Actinomycetospora straminea]
MISADSRRAGFNGVALGRSQVYGAVADAVCIQSPRHRCPSSWCDCGFYCFHALDDARDLACDPQYQHCVLLEVAASGRYVRYELGLRYARQTIRSVRLGRCGCGRAATALADGGPGIVGWRRLHPVCGLCAGPRPVLTPEAFGVLLGHVPVRAEDGADDGFAPLAGLGSEVDDATLVPLLSAEVALLQARLDQVQSRLEQLTHRSD